MKKFLQFFVLFMVFVSFDSNLFAQGNTTSSINGKVKEKSGEPLPGATVLATHTPSGSRYAATTDSEGTFRISNMRVGGPYKIEISYVGFKTYTESDAFLQLGESK